MSGYETVTVEISVRMLTDYRAAYKAEIAAPTDEWEKARENRLNMADLIAVWALLQYEEQHEDTAK